MSAKCLRPFGINPISFQEACLRYLLELISSHPKVLSSSLNGYLGEKAPECSDILLFDDQLIISTLGITLMDWKSHFWIQKIPIPQLATSEINQEYNEFNRLFIQNNISNKINKFNHINLKYVKNIAINFETPNLDRLKDWVAALKDKDIIFDLDSSRAILLRKLGFPAFWLNPESPSNGWLDQPKANDLILWESLLGLPEPPSDHIILLGEAGAAWNESFAKEFRDQTFLGDTEISYFPGWDELIVQSPVTALAQAGWIFCASKQSKMLACQKSYDPITIKTFSLFPPSLYVFDSLNYPQQLREKIDNINTLVFHEERFQMPNDIIFSWDSEATPKVSILISLYNYQDRIIDALESILKQSQQDIELIVLDDFSQDESMLIVANWMKDKSIENHSNLVRMVLIRHLKNFGLAAARNTAFMFARTEWCFVLDADNILLPDAIKLCYQIALGGSSKLAVVHPLLLVEAEKGRNDDQRSLVSSASWQKVRLMQENTTDAMALIRHSAWETVNGFTHIEGGWEDYDFWCKLIESGFHGVQCPQILGIYRSHQNSMSHTSTNLNWFALARTLKRRHSWMRPSLFK